MPRKGRRICLFLPSVYSVGFQRSTPIAMLRESRVIVAVLFLLFCFSFFLFFGWGREHTNCNRREGERVELLYHLMIENESETIGVLDAFEIGTNSNFKWDAFEHVTTPNP